MALNILLVDDSDIIRAMIARTLRLAEVPLGELFEASNGREALDVLDTEWVDLVLADLNMPVMDGAEMLARMRQDPDKSDIPVIVVSTEGATERIKDLSVHGVTAWVRKPFTPEEIRDVICAATERSKVDPAVEVALEHILSQVIETFAFSLPEPCDGVDGGDAKEFVRADIAFGGAVVGSLSLVASTELCGEMAANILGVEPDDEDAMSKAADTLAELVNITAGHLCTEIDPHNTTKLHPPVATRMSISSWDDFRAGVQTRLFMVEAQPLAMQLHLQPATAAL